MQTEKDGQITNRMCAITSNPLEQDHLVLFTVSAFGALSCRVKPVSQKMCMICMFQ